MPETDLTNQHSAEIAVLKSDVARMGEFFGRLDTAIEKISDLSNNVTKMLAVHDQRLDAQDDAFKTYQEKIGDDIRDLYGLVNAAKTDISTGFASFESKASNIVDEKTKGLGKRVDALERWRWLVVGGGAVVLCALGYIVPVLMEHLAKSPGH